MAVADLVSSCRYSLLCVRSRTLALRLEVPLQFQSTVEDAKNVDRPVLLRQVEDAVASIQQNANPRELPRLVLMSHLRKFEEEVSPIVDTAHDLTRSLGTIA